MSYGLLAIDPGDTASAYTVIDSTARRPMHSDKIPNADLLDRLRRLATADRVVIEMVASYGMPVGREVFDTCVWIGRFVEAVRPLEAELVFRRDVKLHHCGSAKAKDANVTQALIDRFASGQPSRGKGTKKAPGWFHGFRADIWQAYALAVYAADQEFDGGAP